MSGQVNIKYEVGNCCPYDSLVVWYRGDLAGRTLLATTLIFTGLPNE